MYKMLYKTVYKTMLRKGPKPQGKSPPPPGRRRDPDLLQIIGAIITDRIETQTKKSSDRKAVSELSVVL